MSQKQHSMEEGKNILNTVTQHWLLQITPNSNKSTQNGAHCAEGTWEESQCDMLGGCE